jgi:dCTP deaminase
LISLNEGDAIAQVLFHFLDEPAEKPYDGKYQNQKRGPQQSLKEIA